MQTSHSRRTYDYRIQEAICETGDRDLFSDLEIPRSTIRSWFHRGVPDVVTCDLVARDRADLLAEIHRYQQRTALLGAIVGLLIAMLRISKVRLDYERLPEGGPRGSCCEQSSVRGRSCRSTQRSESHGCRAPATTVGVVPRPGAIWMTSPAVLGSSPRA